MKQLNKVIEALDYLLDVHYKFTLNHAKCFLYIAAHRDEIIETRDLVKELKMTQSSLNRSLRSLAKRSYIHEEGFGLLEINTSPADERQRVVTLSQAGLEIAMKMEEKIYGKS
jgi:DNA-binding MarR family transcriptional regulator